MTKALPYLLVSAVLAIAFLVGYCNRPKGYNETLAPAEQRQASVINTDSIYRVAFQAGEAKYSARYKALQRDSTAAASKDKQATKKAQHSADKYAKNKTLANCDTAYSDCKEEVAAKVAVIATRDNMLLAKDSTLAKRMAEIDRRGLVIDTLNAGWQQANADNAKEKEKNWGLGLQLGGSIINGKPTPYIGAGLNYNFVRFRIKLPKK